MSSPTPTNRGGKPFHSILEPHFAFIHQQRQRRKTWQEIADLLFTEKGLHVTYYAPYSFYRRRLKRAAKTHWESETTTTPPATVNPTTPQPTTTNPYKFNTNI